MESRTRQRWRKWGIALLLASIALAFTGCRTLKFYGQAISGQFDILARQEPLEKLLNSTNTSAQLKRQLVLLQELRSFAERELDLKVNGHYRKYADLERPFVVWNVEAAREFSLEPKTWWYPMVGRLEYRGFFSREAAREYAGYLRNKSLDVYSGGVQAYSTLGWFKDPALNTFIFLPDSELAELIFHELGHQTVFAAGDTDFNEAFATTVGEEGVRRWLKAKNAPEALASYEEDLRRNRQIVRLVLDARTQLERLYGDVRDKEGKLKATSNPHNLSDSALRLEKQRIQNKLRAEYQSLISQWPGYTGYAFFFEGDLNNAKLNSIANYYDFVPGFERLLELNKGHLPDFYSAVERLAKKSKAERHEWLGTLGIEPAVSGISNASSEPKASERSSNN
jgi:predicted aminopeptidase